MNKLTALAIAALAGLFGFSAPALASMDQSCVPEIEALTSNFNRCDVSGVLVPENDTRDNLIFLLADLKEQQLLTLPRAPRAEFDTAGEGSICVSDNVGKANFVAALNADTSVPEVEKLSLRHLRGLLNCTQGGSEADIVPRISVQSDAGKEFAAYLAAVTRFYYVDHTRAYEFELLASSRQPWVMQTARYMRARVALLAAQATAFDEYGTIDFSLVNQDKVAAARVALENYLRDYPAGFYAASAKGLLRRATWLAHDTLELTKTYSKALTATEVNELTVELADEVDLKFPEEGYFNIESEPVLVAVQVLRLMRAGAEKKITREELETLHLRFGGREDLYQYLQAAYAWHVEKNANAVLKILPDRPVPAKLSYVEFSRQMLRAAALDKKGDASAREKYLALFPAAQQMFQNASLQKALAMHDERHKKIAAVFEPGTPVRDTDIRVKLLDKVAGPIILRQQATDATASTKERETAVFRLLARDLTHGRFDGFLEDIKLLPPPPVKTGEDEPIDKFAVFRWKGAATGYACPGLPEIAGLLNANRKDVKGRICLGDFIRASTTEFYEDLYGDAAEKDALGGSGTIFGGAQLARHDFYTDIMRDAKATRDERAYALYRAVHCYAPIGNNDCRGKDVSPAQRKKWYFELKGKYGDTDWAKKSTVYW